MYTLLVLVDRISLDAKEKYIFLPLASDKPVSTLEYAGSQYALKDSPFPDVLLTYIDIVEAVHPLGLYPMNLTKRTMLEYNYVSENIDSDAALLS